MTSAGDACATVETLNVSRVFGGEEVVRALDDVSISIFPGEFVAVQGPSGCGKSTLLHLLGAIDTPTTGTVRFTGIDISTLTDNERSGLRRRHIGMVLRRVPNEFLTFQQLGLPPICEQLIQRPRGLFLVTGPTGSGKTTSLASMINWMNHNMDHHIITLEDPIEYFHKHAKSTINQREIGVDVPDFPEALRRALRMDPDAILVGEMRDLETISSAITAAETGHVVFGTLHTTGAQGTVDRIIDVFPTNQQEQIRTQLAAAIIGVLSQALLPRKPKGLVAAYEMLVVTSAIANLIREGKTFRINSAVQTGRKHGMQLLDDALFDLWRKQLCDEDDVVRKANASAELKLRIMNAKKGVFDDEEEEDEDDD